ncbi:hypothetical protein L2E82_18270 [Cichorium intybus]|uniref:Uncharacterized protein n=1 Tax=Cichorium intybus TaxID=13427 RepID=A0ACB9FA49_CICIN|nr:hypothetical protein L2E82_18270 [Cichorium intybus]
MAGSAAEVVPEKENEFNVGGDLLKSPELEGSQREPLLPETKKSSDLEVGVGHVNSPAERYSFSDLVRDRQRIGEAGEEGFAGEGCATGGKSCCQRWMLGRRRRLRRTWRTKVHASVSAVRKMDEEKDESMLRLRSLDDFRGVGYL